MRKKKKEKKTNTKRRHKENQTDLNSATEFKTLEEQKINNVFGHE